MARCRECRCRREIAGAELSVVSRVLAATMTFAERFQPVEYASLDARQQERVNFAHVASRLAGYGFACYWIDADWNGTDFLAHHMPSGRTLNVQLKGRITIDRKYRKRDIWMAFPNAGHWFVVPHDELVEAWLEVNPKLLEAESWKGSRGRRHAPRPPSGLEPFLSRWQV